jgi:hypothetical protein
MDNVQHTIHIINQPLSQTFRESSLYHVGKTEITMDLDPIFTLPRRPKAVMTKDNT